MHHPRRTFTPRYTHNMRQISLHVKVSGHIQIALALQTHAYKIQLCKTSVVVGMCL